MNEELTEMLEKGGELAASAQWRPLIESLEDDFDKALVAQLLQNERTYIDNMDEDVRISSIGSYEKFVFPVIRAVFPNLIAKDLVSVQPMSGPTSLVFYLDAVYGSNKGSISAGDTMFHARKGHLTDDQYSSEKVDGEVIDASTSSLGSGGTTTGTLDYASCRPGTLTISDDDTAITFADNGVGGLVPSAGAHTGTINYTTGAWSITYDTTGPADASVISAVYWYNSEGSPNIPIVDLTISSVPVTARPHKLRARWSVEAATNLRALHTMDAESELVALLSEKIRWDIDRKIISDLQTIAAAGTVTFDRSPPSTSISWNDHKQTFIDTLIQASNLIFKATRRGTGNYIVCDVLTSNILESLYGFRPQAVAGNGVVFMGTLQNRWSVYKDPYMADNTFMVGYKGSNFLESGYVFAPYVPLFMTPTYMLDDMLNRKGMMSQFATKGINGDYYATGSIITS
jgi:hypothetical protein